MSRPGGRRKRVRLVTVVHVLAWCFAGGLVVGVVAALLRRRPGTGYEVR